MAGVWARWASRVGAVAVVGFATSFVGCDLLGFGSQAMPTVAYRVSARLVENTCGPQSAPVEAAVTFVARLGLSGGRATWRVPASGAFASGTYNDGTGAFRFAQLSQLVLIPADRRAMFVGCAVDRLDIIDGTAEAASASNDAGADASADGDGGSMSNDAAADGSASALDGSPSDGGGSDGGASNDAGMPATFAATETIVIGVSQGADCMGAIGVNAGQYTVLPCTQRIEMRAVRQDETPDAH